MYFLFVIAYMFKKHKQKKSYQFEIKVTKSGYDLFYSLNRLE